MASNEDIIAALQGVQESLSEAANAVSKAIARLEGGSQVPPPDWLQPRLKLFNAIKKKGGDIKDDDLQKVASSLGYKKLSGFYHGKRAGLMKLSNERTALTKAAEQRLEEWGDWVKTLP